MNASTRRQLEARLDAELDAVSQQLVQNPGHDVADGLNRIETYSRLLNARPPSSRQSRIWAAAIGVCCLLVVSLLAAGRTRDTKVLLDVVTTSAALQLADSLDWSGTLPFAARDVRVDGLSSVDAQFVKQRIATPRHDAWLTIASGDTALTRLQVAGDGILHLEQGEGRRLSLFLRQADLSGELQVLGDLALGMGGTGAADQAGHATLAVPESIPFFRKGEGIVPAALQATLADDWFLKDVPVRMLSVNRDVPGEPGTVSVLSSLKGGTVVLPEVSREIALRERDHLTLDGVDGLLTEARLEADGIHLIFQGEVGRVRLGPPGYSQNLAPTYLEYLYHSQPLGLFWASASFLGGLLWGIRRTWLT